MVKRVLQNIAQISVMWFCLSGSFYGQTSLSDFKPIRDTVLPFSLFRLSFCHWSHVIHSRPSLSDPLFWLDKVPFWGQGKIHCSKYKTLNLECTQNFSCPFLSYLNVLLLALNVSFGCYICLFLLFAYTYADVVAPRGEACAVIGFPKQLLWKWEQYHRQWKQRAYICKTSILWWLHASQSHCSVDVLLVD